MEAISARFDKPWRGAETAALVAVGGFLIITSIRTAAYIAQDGRMRPPLKSVRRLRR
jgi:hypothetical protein